MNILVIRKIYFIFPMKQICSLIRQIVYFYFCIIYFWQIKHLTISFTLQYLFFYDLHYFLYLHNIHSLGIVVKCFQSERSSRQSLQFLRPTHQNFNFISVSGRFGRIFCLFFMARIQFPHKSSALTASFSVRQPPNAPFVLSCPLAGPRLPCGCRRRCTGFPSASSWP